MNKVEAAGLKARMSAFLSNNPGKHSTEEVAKVVGVSNRTAGQVLLHMSKAGLIAPMERKGTTKLWSWPEGATPLSVDQIVAVAATAKVQKADKPVAKAKEIELVFSGLLVVIGKNEKTGRLRITLEET